MKEKDLVKLFDAVDTFFENSPLADVLLACKRHHLARSFEDTGYLNDVSDYVEGLEIAIKQLHATYKYVVANYELSKK